LTRLWKIVFRVVLFVVVLVAKTESSFVWIHKFARVYIQKNLK